MVKGADNELYLKLKSRFDQRITTNIKSKPNFYYDISEGEDNSLLNDEGKIFIASYQGCKDCCCYYGGERIFFVMNNQLAWNQLDVYSSSGGFGKRKCETNIQTVRFNKKNSTAYLYALYGDCENQLTSIMSNFQKFYELEKHFKSFTHDMFIKIKINEDDLDIKRIIDKGIPAEYKQEWEEAEEIWKKRD